MPSGEPMQPLEATQIEAVASPFKSIVVKDITPAEIDMLWESLGFNTKPDELLQYNRQHNLLIESALTALAKNTKNLNESAKQAANESSELKKKVDQNTAAIAKIAEKAEEDETAAALRELMKQFTDFKIESGRQMSQLSAELASQQEENGKLRGDLARLSPLMDQVANLSTAVAGCQRDVNRANAAAAAPVDFTPLWEECAAIRSRLLLTHDMSLQHKEQLELALEELAAEGAADDVLANLDFESIAEIGDIVDGIDEESEIFKSVKKQTLAIGGVALNNHTQIGGLFALGSYDVQSCFRKWRDIVNTSPRRGDGHQPTQQQQQQHHQQQQQPQTQPTQHMPQSDASNIASTVDAARNAAGPVADAQPSPQNIEVASAGTNPATTQAAAERAATPPIQGLPHSGRGQPSAASSNVSVSSKPLHKETHRVLAVDPEKEKQKKQAGIAKVVDDKIGRKMEERVQHLQLMHDVAELTRLIGELKAEIAEADIVGLRSEMERMNGQLGAVELAAKAAASAAAAASEKADNVAAEASKDKKPEGFDKMMEDVQQIAGMQSTISEMEKALANAMGWQEACEGLRQKVEPIPSLQQAVWDVKQVLPRKVDEAELGRLQMQFEKLERQAEEAAKHKPGAGLGPDVEAALLALAQMDLRGILSEHAMKLAELFNKKASLDDISNAMASMKDLDAKMAQEIETRADSIISEFNQTREDWNQNLNQLGTAINTKADEVWLKSLEEQIREEMEKMRKKTGGKGISKKELDAKLAELRSKLTAAGGLQETGSAVFRCIACSRPLPQTDKWSGPAGAVPLERPAAIGPQFGGAKERQGKQFKDNDADVIMKGGFPMLNPKTKGNRKMTPEETSRMFGKNLAPDAIAPQASGDSRPGSLPPMTDRPLPVPGAQPRISPRSQSVPPPLTPDRPSSRGNYGKSTTGVDESWPPPSVPHYDSYGQFAGADRQITTPEPGAVRKSAKTNFPV
eukprot:SAG31_NODE_2150_length_6327_cov_4.325947_6_plen_974_part_00